MQEVIEDEFDKVMVVNCKLVYFIVMYFVLVMIEVGKGVILNVVFIVGFSLCLKLNWYNVFKGWMIMVMKIMVVEFVLLGVWVNVFCLVVGEILFLKSFMGEDILEIWVKFFFMILIGWFFMLEDMGNVVCYLCLDEVGMIMGVVMEVDGGCCI